MESAGLGLYTGLENITCVFSYGFCLLLCNLACGRGHDSRIYLDHQERDKRRSLFTPFAFLSQTFLVRWHDGPRERSWEGVEACLG